MAGEFHWDADESLPLNSDIFKTFSEKGAGVMKPRSFGRTPAWHRFPRGVWLGCRAGISAGAERARLCACSDSGGFSKSLDPSAANPMLPSGKDSNESAVLRTGKTLEASG